MQRRLRHLLAGLAAGGITVALSACGSTEATHLQEEIQRLDLRVDQLEQRLSGNGGTQRPPGTDTPPTDVTVPSGAIRSLTFRMGTEDDRLRVYWADGSTSDLPCTKEQNVWACG